jgi:uncharacterized membrane protein
MKKFGVWFFGLTFIAIGIVHFASPDTFVGIIPNTDLMVVRWWGFGHVLEVCSMYNRK